MTGNFAGASGAIDSNPFISVIICTYGRAAALEGVLDSLENQSYRNFEVLVVDGNGDVSPARETIEKRASRPHISTEVIVIRSPKGLTRQRNVGVKAAQGSLICFLDDDVTFEADFLAQVVGYFSRPEMQDVGGITPYDVLNYPMPITMRWRLRNLLGVMPSLDPGQVDHLGRAVPISFLKPWPGQKQIGWLGGFCMIYRRTAMEGLAFDEALPTYGGEDRDFSMRVGKRWRLMICGDLLVQHHYTMQGRETDLECVRQSSFGVGRRFAQHARTFRDCLTIASTFLGDLILDAMSFARHPRSRNFQTLVIRSKAFFAGLRSTRKEDRQEARIIGSKPLEQSSDSVSNTP
jgi:glycosyltransferase involved in cell wall biosynthesis